MGRGASWYFFSLSLLLPFSDGLILDSNSSTSDLSTSYDYIIVGAGPGGLVVANRLSEDPNGSEPLLLSYTKLID